jgi:predicted aldo/keto reductase-like oxidoreductase
MAAHIPSLQLNNGTRMPAVGIGSWMGEPNARKSEVEDLVKHALKNGYRLIDTASTLFAGVYWRSQILLRHLDMETKSKSGR